MRELVAVAVTSMVWGLKVLWTICKDGILDLQESPCFLHIFGEISLMEISNDHETLDEVYRANELGHPQKISVR